MIRPVGYPLKHGILGVVKSGGLRWMGLLPPQMTLGWQDVGRVMRPFKIRWAVALLLAITIVPAMGELGPAVSAIAAAP